MAVEINNETTLHSPNSFLTLDELREFVQVTAEMSGNTKVRIRAVSSQRDSFVEMKAKYGDIDDRRY